MNQNELLNVLENIAIMLEIKGESPFKSRAYQNAADIIKVQQLDVSKLIENDELGNINGFGKALVEKITDFYKNGKMEYYEKLKKDVPLSLIEITKLEGIGNKKAGQLNRDLGILDIGDLEVAAKEKKIQELNGFSENTQEKIIKAIKDHREAKKNNSYKSFKNIM